MPAVTTFDALLSGYTWNGVFVPGRPTFVTYSFDTTASETFDRTFSQAFLESFRTFTAAEQDTARAALKAWSDASGLTFLEVPAGMGDIRFGLYNFALGPEEIEDRVGFAYPPAVVSLPEAAYEYDYGGDVFIAYGAATFGVLVHEIGHAIGLKHPFEGATTLDATVDDLAHTVMTYNTQGGQPTALGSFDVLAVQFLYGFPESKGTQAASWSWDPARQVLAQTGGIGKDVLAGVATTDNIRAGDGADYVMTRGGDDRVEGEEGDDTLSGGDGDDTLDGGAGADVLDGDLGADALTGGDGDDELWGLDGPDTLTGGRGDDTLAGGFGTNNVLGGEGDDLVLMATGATIADGGEGFDELAFLAPRAGSYSYADLSFAGNAHTNFEAISLFGSTGADTLQGGDLEDALIGDAGADSLSGGTADDFLFGGSGTDTLSSGTGADMLDGSSGDDLLLPGLGADDIWGGTGSDTVDLSGELSGVQLTVNAVRLLEGGAQETMNGVENIVGTAFGDNITGDAGANRLFGAAGSDTLRGGDGANYLRGDDGTDVLVGGGEFDDINGNVGDDSASGGLGDDWVVGGRDNDILAGDAGGDLVYGNLGADTCEGGEGADTLRGGQENDAVRGGAGDDFVSGDKGDDTMSGGDGADVFHSFGDAGIDRVTDFSLAQGDRVMLDPGTQFTVAQIGADTVISMTGGGQVILVGVALSSLTGTWLFGA